MVHVETTTSIEIVPADQLLKLHERMWYLQKENAQTKAENSMLAKQLYEVYEKSDDANNKNIKGKAENSEHLWELILKVLAREISVFNQNEDELYFHISGVAY